MAPLPTIPGTFRCALVTDNRASVNVIHVHSESGTISAVNSAIAGAVNANMWKVWLGFLHVRQIYITPLEAPEATVVFDTDGSAKWGGSATGSEHVPSACAVVSLKTAFRGRSARGRIFVGPVAESELTNGLLNDATRASMVSGWSSFGSALLAEDMEHVVASYKNETALTVTSYSIRRPAGTLRLRHDRDTGV